MSNELKLAIDNVIEEYLHAKNEKFVDNSLGHFIRNDFPKIINNNLLYKDSIKVRGSCGQARWAEIPWVAVLDRRITETTQEGFYIVYLFQADMNGVYLSLNQGWKFFEETYGFKKGKQEIQRTAKNYQQTLKSEAFNSLDLHSSDFSFSPIFLNNKNQNTSLAKGYELGHIYGKYYKKDEVPSQEQLFKDLNKINDIYQELIEYSTSNTKKQISVLSDLETIIHDETIKETQRQRLIEARLGQGRFRKEVSLLYPQCPITQVQLPALLKASHIKPWGVSSDKERLDKFNGFMLSAHIDALFDTGYISFSDEGELLISTQHNVKSELSRLNINQNVKIKIFDQTYKYLAWHRKHVFKN